MDPQVLNVPNVSSDFNAPKSNKKPLASLILLIIVAILGWVVYVLFFSSPKITGLEVAVKISSFLDETLEVDGGMTSGMFCNKNTKVCSDIKTQTSDQPHLGQAIYSYYLLGRITEDSSYREKADKTMDFVIKKCASESVAMCAWNFFPLARYYFDTKENKYLIAMETPAELFLKLSDEDLILQNTGHKLASLYKATEREEYKTRLLSVANQELSSWPPNPNSPQGRSIQVVWSVFLPAYDITKDEKYLNASKEFFDNFKLNENFSKFLYLDPVVKGVDALITLNEITEKASYKKDAQRSLQELLNKYWDNPENLKATGDYGFVEMPEKEVPPVLTVKKTITNGWISKSFIRLSKEKFILPLKNEN